MDCHIHSNWGIESIAQQIEAATKGERDQKTSSSRSLVDLQTAFPLAEAASEALLAALSWTVSTTKVTTSIVVKAPFT